MKRVLFCLLFTFCINFFSAQKRLAYLSYIFPQDSLVGFNEINASNEALHGGYFGLEHKVFMYRFKREFINKKYGYVIPNNFSAANTSERISASSCVNQEFESLPVGSVTSVPGWTITEGSNTSSCSMAGCCSAVATGTNSWIRATPIISTGPTPTIPNSPLGGSQIIQLGDSIPNMSEVVRLEKNYLVSSTNSFFQYAVFALMDGTSHLCCDQPYLNISFYDCSNILIPGTKYAFVPKGASCSYTIANWVNNISGLSYHTGWQVFGVNLSTYIGTCVTIRVTVSDCDAWGHAGYCYFDAGCGPVVSTGIANEITDNPSYKLFPNPNNGEFEIRSQSEENIYIINELGQTIRTIKLSRENNYSAQISDLSSGIYFIIGKFYKQKMIVTK